MSARSYLLRAYYFTSFVALGVYLPYFPPWLEARGIVGLRMGAIAATAPAMGLVGPLLFGALADAFGARRGFLRAAVLGAFGASSAIALAAIVGRPLAYGELFAVVLLFAFFRSPMGMLADVLAIDVARTGGPSYGRMRLWGSLGFLAAAVIGARYIDVSTPAPFPVALASALLVATVAAFALPSASRPPPRPIVSDVRALVRSGEFRGFLAIAVLAQAAHSAYDLCYSLHLRDRFFPPHLVGVAWAIGVVAEVLLMAAPPNFLGRARPTQLLALALGVAAMRWALIAVAHAPAVLFVAQPLHGFSFALMWLASIAFVRDRAPPHALATAQGLFVASAAAGSVIGMLTWGPLYRALGGGAVFGAAAAISLTASMGALLLDARRRIARGDDR